LQKSLFPATIVPMVITYLGGEFYKVQFGDTIVAVNPVAKSSTWKSARFGADIALIGMRDDDHEGIDQTEYNGKKPFVIDGPGEYEIAGVVVKGFGVDHSENKGSTGKEATAEGGEAEKPTTHEPDAPLRSTCYTLSLENMRVGILTSVATRALPSALLEDLNGVDILILPVGSEGVTSALPPASAYKLAVALEAKIIIPSLMDDKKDTVKTFLQEGSAEGVMPIDKLTVKLRDVAEKQGDIVLLSGQ
jgi:hypothetical protein